MSNKRYYWLKLKDDFFEDDTIAWLEEQENGKDYVLFYLKLALKSLSEEGSLIRYVGERLIPYDTKALAKLTNTPVDTVAVAMKVFGEIGLVSIHETGEIYMNQLNELIGSETEVAKRVRQHRAKKLTLKKKETELLHCNSEVTKCNTEIEIDKEIEIKSIEKEYIPFKEIIDYLNSKANRKFRNVEANKKLIRARFNEKYTLDDFKKVIDNKCLDWLGTEWERYLQPSTLFGNKFDIYLNTIPKPKEKERKEIGKVW